MSFTMNQIKILTILVKDRIKETERTQKALTEFAHIIKSRLGFHEVSENKCSRVGVIILQLDGDTNEWIKLENRLAEIGGIEYKGVQFDF
jgi:hypothetical protein